MVTATTAPLAPSEGFTIVAGFPVNTFPKSILNTKNLSAKNNLGWISFIFLIPAGILNLILAPGLLIWYFKTKHKTHFGPVTVNFDIPKDPITKGVITPGRSRHD